VKILHTEASCGWGGQEIRILEESRGLIQRGHEVSVACPAHARMATEAARFGVPVTALPIEFKTIAGLRALRATSHPARPDVVNTHSSADSWLVALACATLHLAARHRAHAPHLGAGRGQLRQPLALPPGSARWRPPARACAGTCSTPSTSIRSASPRCRPASTPSASQSRGDKAAAKAALGLDQNKILGIVATLRSWKGHLYLLDAFAQLQRPDLQLVIVGEGPMREPITEKIAALGLGDRVTLAGQRTDPERWLQAMDVFCLPSYANEGVPQAILQAMLCALPIVTTPVGSILEAVSDGETALVVPPKDATALAAAISRLLDDPALAAHLGDHARRVASADFSKDTMLDRMETLFRQARSS
jgi:glycosyltransferase involved in cell wall biosynthesis